MTAILRRSLRPVLAISTFAVERIVREFTALEDPSLSDGFGAGAFQPLSVG
jgi:hypothetical protein